MCGFLTTMVAWTTLWGPLGAEPPAVKTVTFKTSDGVSIQADYYAPIAKAKAPIVILIHMYPADRKSWSSLAEDLRNGDPPCAVLAYDIRGHGGSTEPKEKNLKAMYDRRDPALFKDAWKDVEAAKVWLSKQPNCDTSRIALIGASIGCSISLDYAGRDENVMAVACLSPGTNYFGVNSIQHIKKCGKAAVLLIAPDAEYDAVKQLVEASGGKAKGIKFPGGRERHGTGLLAEDYSQHITVRKSILLHVARAFAESGRKTAKHKTESK